MKKKEEDVVEVRKRDRLYPTKEELDRYRKLKKEYGIRDEVVVKSREASSRKKPNSRS
jgi:hypothetical protein